MSKHFLKQFKQCGITCTQVVEYHDVKAPTISSRLPLRDVAVAIWNISNMESMMEIPSASDSCSSNLTLSYQDSIPSALYSRGGVNFTRTWFVMDECGNVNSTRHNVFVSSSLCPQATPWGEDCSCTASPPAVNAVLEDFFSCFFITIV